MRVPTVVLSAVIHVGLAAGLIGAAKNREMKRRAISVAVTSEKKKAEKPKPPPPPPPKPVAHHAAPKVVAAVAKAEVPVAPVHAAAAPVQTNLTMSNDDVGPGIGLGAPVKAAPRAAAPAAVKVASAVSERRNRRTQEESAAGGGGDVPCNEEPTKPQPVVTTPTIDYGLYPRGQQEGLEGKFRAWLIIGADGEVTDVEVVVGIEPGFDAAIKAALMRWRFKPAMLCGKPLAGARHSVTARFELAD